LTHQIAHLAVFLVIGVIVGFAGGLFGIGGALLSIPLLSIVFGLDQQHAQGTSLVMGLPNVVVGLWRYSQYPNFDRRAAVILAISAVPFMFGGAYFATHVAGRGLRPAFGVFLIALAIWLAVRAFQPVLASDRFLPRKTGLIATVGAISGTMSGVFSSGGAAFTVPVMSLFFGYAQATAQGLALALIAPGTLVALATYAQAGTIDWQIGIALAIGGSLLIKQGVALAHRLHERTLRLFFSGLLLLSAVALFRSA
jgi:uncharacterized membrane protein YfcA